MISDKKVKKLVTADKTIVHYWDGKMHNWDGPAYIPQGDKKKSQYYINGIRYTKDEWKELKKDMSGQPFYKKSSAKDRY
jgi:hypothetical protein